MSQNQKPSIGRIVHYQSYGTPGGEYLPAPRAAIITAVHEPTNVHPQGTISLAVFNPEGLHFNQEVRFSETPKPGHWSWPPREGGARTGGTLNAVQEETVKKLLAYSFRDIYYNYTNLSKREQELLTQSEFYGLLNWAGLK